MKPDIHLYLDLGDAFTKAIAQGNVKEERVRFPSVVAPALLSGGAEMSQLLLDDGAALPRPTDFAPQQFPRTRSFAGSDAFVREVRGRPPGDGVRFAGQLAAVYGRDRQMLGVHPTSENIDALVHKALMLLGTGERCLAKITFVVDVGAKANAVARYVEQLPQTVVIERRSYRQRGPRRMVLTLTGTVVDAPECASAAIRQAAHLAHVRRWMLVDIGYFRCKLAILSSDGCEHQEELERLGMSDCVRRILRDEQTQGLVEDEFAVLQALEDTGGAIVDIAGRHFDISRALNNALTALEEELTRAIRRVLLQQFGRGGERCETVAVIGGGAALVGRGLARRVKSLDIGVDTVWIGANEDHCLVEGARMLLPP